MKYIKLVIEIADEYQESLIAELFDMDFDGFEQRDNEIITYITKENFGINDRERIDQLLAAYPGDGFIQSEEVVADQNWNEQWEETIKAQEVGQFFIRPTWVQTETPKGKQLLEIDPKMSFGTGYHETTRLMLRMLPKIIEQDARFVDAGTGTGILSIAAIKLGAKYAFAFDIDEWSISNTKENILLNDVADFITVTKGSTEVIPNGEQADVVAANIERNTILKLLNDLDEALKPGGVLLLSGLLEGDKKSVLKNLADYFEVEEILKENEWVAIQARKIA
ncbi:MAG: 50S ribosomal protein L11 methyltransferase [Fodinibius sp.]|nr:50S ribosomal protein L11 methyltransferase [Fodinibius sp.]